MLNQSIFGIIILLLTNAFVIAHGGYCFVILLDNIAVYFNVVVAEIIADNSISLLINLCFLCVLKLNPTQSNLSCRSITTSVICVRFKCHLQASHVNCPHRLRCNTWLVQRRHIAYHYVCTTQLYQNTYYRVIFTYYSCTRLYTAISFTNAVFPLLLSTPIILILQIHRLVARI